jgi:hypothetical protein
MYYKPLLEHNSRRNGTASYLSVIVHVETVLHGPTIVRRQIPPVRVINLFFTLGNVKLKGKCSHILKWFKVKELE